MPCICPRSLLCRRGSRRQTLAQRVAAVGDGTVRLSFAARRGVCGNGGHNITIMSDDERRGVGERLRARPGAGVAAGARRPGHRGAHVRRRPVARTEGGDDRPRHRAGRARRRRTCSRWPSGPSGDAEELVTGRHAGGQRGRLARPAAAGPPGPTFRSRPAGRPCSGSARRRARRRRAGLDSLAADERGDLEVRKQAVFALSQRPADEGVPGADPHRPDQPAAASSGRRALFWLGQSEDPRALALFEELLR